MKLIIKHIKTKYKNKKKYTLDSQWLIISLKNKYIYIFFDRILHFWIKVLTCSSGAWQGNFQHGAVQVRSFLFLPRTMICSRSLHWGIYTGSVVNIMLFLATQQIGRDLPHLQTHVERVEVCLSLEEMTQVSKSRPDITGVTDIVKIPAAAHFFVVKWRVWMLQNHGWIYSFRRISFLH